MKFWFVTYASPYLAQSKISRIASSLLYMQQVCASAAGDVMRINKQRQDNELVNRYPSFRAHADFSVCIKPPLVAKEADGVLHRSSTRFFDDCNHTCSQKPESTTLFSGPEVDGAASAATTSAYADTHPVQIAQIEPEERSNTMESGATPNSVASTAAEGDLQASDANQSALEQRFQNLYIAMMEKQVSFKEAVEPFKTDNQNAGKG